jgi:hypothetical protein
MPTFFPPSGLVKKDDFIAFDDREFIKQCQSAYIEKLTVYQGELINGLEVSYVLDGILKTVAHHNNQGEKHSLVMVSDEHINSIATSWSDAGLHSLELTTNTGKRINVLGSRGPGPQSKTFTCAAERRGVVAFKGLQRSALGSLLVYTWKLAKVVH